MIERLGLTNINLQKQYNIRQIRHDNINMQAIKYQYAEAISQYAEAMKYQYAEAIKYQYAEAIKYQCAEATSYKMLHKVSTNTITVSDYLKVIMKLCHTRHTHNS